ncbi:MAG: peptide ABC transporter permease [Acidobacteria bacterium 13_1_40CM_4_69_4]|nr:MAG: peptide ABC transporter permease [Acidobacteria bacterium 13_1_40CM_4_69_4]
MRAIDLLRLSWGAVAGHRLRSVLTMLGIAIGIASVILLTSIGEGIRVYVLSEFTQFGTNLIGINPGKSNTSGGNPTAMAGTIRKLTIEDAEVLRRVPDVDATMPVSFGNARVEHGARGRSVLIYGVTSDVPRVWKFGVRHGSFLPEGDPHHGSPLVVLGMKLKREVFGDDNALGERVRIGGRPFRVIGVMEPKGQFLNLDLDDTAFVPVSEAMRLFNRDDLIEIDVVFRNAAARDHVVGEIRRILIDRHQGDEDFTITTQESMLTVLNRIIGVVTSAVGAIGGISLVVGAIGILTMMWISVNESTAEIGLLRALGARRGQVLALFLLQAALLATAGGALGILAGIGIARTLRFALPRLPVHTPIQYVVAALVLSFAVGLLSGALPARRAAGLDPVEALRAE